MTLLKLGRSSLLHEVTKIVRLGLEDDAAFSFCMFGVV